MPSPLKYYSLFFIVIKLSLCLNQCIARDQHKDEFRNEIAFIDSLESKGELELADSIYQQLLYENPNLTDSLSLALGLRFGVLKLRRGNYEQARDLFQELLKIRFTVNDSLVARVFNGLGLAYLNLDVYDSSTYIFHEGIAFSKSSTQSHNYYYLHTNLGLVHKELGNYRLALYHYDEALKVNDLRNKNGHSAILSNIGEVFYRKKQNDSATVFFNRALDLQRSNDDFRGEMISLVNIANIKFRLGLFNEALDLYKQCLSLNEEKLKIQYATETLLRNIGNVFIELEQYDSAELYARKSIEIHEMTGALETLSQSLFDMSEIFKDQGKYDSSIFYLKRGYQVRDSVFQIDKEKAIQEIEGKYENEKLKRLNVEQELKTRRLYNSLLVAIIVTTFLIYFIVYLVRETRRKLAVKESEKQQEILNERKLIFDENHRAMTTIWNKAGTYEKISAGKSEILKEQAELVRLFDHCFPDFINNLKNEYPEWQNISSRQLILCRLFSISWHERQKLLALGIGTIDTLKKDRRVLTQKLGTTPKSSIELELKLAPHLGINQKWIKTSDLAPNGT